MAISVVHKTTNSQTGGTSLTVTFTAATNGNRLIVVHSATTPTANVTGPVNFQSVAPANNSGSTASIGNWHMRAAGGETTVSFSYSVACNSEAIVYEVDGLVKVSVTAVCADRSTTNAGVASTSATLTFAAATQYPNEFRTMGVGTAASMGALVSMTGGIADDTSGGIAGLFLCGSAIMNTTGTFASTITWTNSVTNADSMVSYRDSSLDGPWPLITS